jgi:deazaflavin-dependent oxidoreductase (nitroreductase family)
MSVRRAFLELEWAVHRTLFGLTGGRVGVAPPRGGAGTLFLLSTGRRSGKVRRNGLYYIEDGPNLVVVASNAGENVDPQWWRNLKITPDAEIELGMNRRAIHARQASPEEADALWPRLDAAHNNFVEYRQRAYRRTIPVIILEPREGGSGSEAKSD